VLVALGCSGATVEESKHDALPFDQSPIVFVSQESPGTYLLRLAEGRPEQLNGHGDVAQMVLSPSRRRLAQVIFGTADVEIYEVMPGGAQIAVLRNAGVPLGQLLGWAGEDALVFATDSNSGLTRFEIPNGTLRHFDPPLWAGFERNGPPGLALSPDGRGVAVVDWTQGQPLAPDGFALFVTDTETGAVVDTWPIPASSFPGSVHWAKDGHIVYYTLGGSTLLIGERGAEALTAVTLPINVCGDTLNDWVTPDTLETAEIITVESPPGCWECGATTSTCANSWVISTDGTRARQRSGERPIAISPDGQKILFFSGDGKLAISDPAGGEQTVLVGIPNVYDAVW